MSHKQQATTIQAPLASGMSEQGRQKRVIEKLKVRPGQQSHVHLGNFTHTQPPKGFVVELNPDPFPDDSVVTKVLSADAGKKYSLTLHIANYGASTVTAEIQQLS